MDWNRPPGVVLVLVGVALAVPVALDPPSTEAGGPAIAYFYGVVFLRGGGGVLLATVGYVTLSSGRARLGATTLTAATVVAAVWLTVQLDYLRELTMPAFTALAVAVFLGTVGGVYRAFDG